MENALWPVLKGGFGAKNLSGGVEDPAGAVTPGAKLDTFDSTLRAPPLVVKHSKRDLSQAIAKFEFIALCWLSPKKGVTARLRCKAQGADHPLPRAQSIENAAQMKVAADIEFDAGALPLAWT